MESEATVHVTPSAILPCIEGRIGLSYRYSLCIIRKPNVIRKLEISKRGFILGILSVIGIRNFDCMLNEAIKCCFPQKSSPEGSQRFNVKRHIIRANSCEHRISNVHTWRNFVHIFSTQTPSLNRALICSNESGGRYNECVNSQFTLKIFLASIGKPVLHTQGWNYCG